MVREGTGVSLLKRNEFVLKKLNCGTEEKYKSLFGNPPTLVLEKGISFEV